MFRAPQFKTDMDLLEGVQQESSHKGDEWPGASPVSRKAEQPGSVQPGEKTERESDQC